MFIEFVIGDDEPSFNVIRNENGTVHTVEIDYRLTLLQLHLLSKKHLSVDELVSYCELMQPKAACTHLEPGAVQTRGYLKAI